MHAHEADFVTCYENAEFPYHVFDKIKDVGSTGLDCKDFGGPGLTSFESGAMLYEMAKYDGSVTLSWLAHNCLGLSAIHQLGTEEQRARMLPGLIRLDDMAAFGLTEPLYGSDASSLVTTATKVQGGYHLNGEKRWIGHADRAKYTCVFARNLDEGGKV